MIAKGRYKDRIRIEKLVSDTALDGGGEKTWQKVAMSWAEFQDARPGKTERIANGTTSATRAARVIMPYRTDVTAAMRVVLVEGDRDVRVTQIVSPPATLGRREAIEFVVEDYSPSPKAD